MFNVIFMVLLTLFCSFNTTSFPLFGTLCEDWTSVWYSCRTGFIFLSTRGEVRTFIGSPFSHSPWDKPSKWSTSLIISVLILLHRQCGCKRNDGFSFLNLNQHSEWVFSLFLSPTPHAEWQTITATQRTVVTDFRVCSWPATCFLHSVKCGKIKTTASQLDKLLHEEKEGYHSINMCDSSESVPVRTGLMESFDTRCNDNHLKLNTSETKELVVENSDDCNWLCVCSLTRMRQAWGRSDLDLWPFLGAFLKKYLLCSRDRRWHKTGWERRMWHDGSASGMEPGVAAKATQPRHFWSVTTKTQTVLDSDTEEENKNGTSWKHNASRQQLSAVWRRNISKKKEKSPLKVQCVGFGGISCIWTHLISTETQWFLVSVMK